MKPLVATLIHQLLPSIPDLKPIIIPRIESDPLIFTKSLKTQFEFLIFGPLRQLKRSFVHLNTLVFLFDGVDECDDKDDQAELIRIVADFVSSNSFPAIAFFASRSEAQITTAFRSPEVMNVTLRMPLDDHYLPDSDIRLFLNDSFQKIRTAHPFGHFLDDNWPAPAKVEEIVRKSSGQFIYASVVIKFCSMLDQHPEQQLKIVRGLRPRGALTPFAQLDALYRHIFSQVPDLEVTSLILVWSMLTYAHNSVENCAEFVGLQTSEVHVALFPLQSVVDCTSAGDIHFLHASLPDFLLDSERSQEYHINLSTWATRLSVMAYKFVMVNGDQYHIPLDMYLTEAEATPELRDLILTYDPDDVDYMVSPETSHYLDCVKRLDFGDGPGGAVYQQQLRAFVRFIRQEGHSFKHSIGDSDDIYSILGQIESEPTLMETDEETEED
ncbi:hypothetical protein HYPSUDRAFT_46811 [Hypholoma sublateritium FD-334 SS-4]|uniref:Nephrocystin 3-like N-terminal domain-containing protein n=1 Tax=Hypholoma sublateritium (strain FD-334 SS-4) TaxID=945553 RepID=A0A0D2NKA8_HYPSF|nr:hypothetical protein HYPSUDRAFT_46811 [Hypholoma sublateritium FD-334 SS-4]